MALATPVTLGTCWGKAASAAVNLSSFIPYHDYRYDDELSQNAGSPV
jgi:hypothetical protein